MFSDSSNSDDSEVPEALLNSKSAFRVSVCLERYYTDVRARCYILVPRNRRVRWLQSRLQKLFPSLVNFHLSTNGHMLPPSEPLALLTQEDAIDVIPYQETRVDLISNKDDTNLSLRNNKRKSSALNTPYGNKLSNTAIYHSPHQDSNKRFLNSEKLINSNCSLQDDIDGVNISPALKEISPLNLYGSDLKSINKLDQSNNTHSLLNLKQQALALLESQAAVETNITEPLDQDSLPSRRRRRVRKRKAHMQTLSQLEHQPLPDFLSKDGTTTPTPIEPVPSTEDVAETINPASPSVEQSSTDGVLLSPQHEVARNNAICSRKPRLVQSLN